jgi:hypothetical protein
MNGTQLAMNCQFGMVWVSSSHLLPSREVIAGASLAVAAGCLSDWPVLQHSSTDVSFNFTLFGGQNESPTG